MCGEKCCTRPCRDCLPGSPPRVRGKERQDGTFASASGITPACAGKSIASPFSFTLLQDHPRVCGEKPFLAAELALMTGSPPRVRGKAFMKRYFSSYGGITPACAGKSGGYPNHHHGDWDHPRVCGEKPYSSLPYTAPSGSPPRVRGKGIAATCVSRSPGITPACAGKRSPSTTQRSSHGDHPRVCGEKTTICCCCATPLGSPPRVRGKDGAPADVIAGFGITPACAGKRSRPG